MRWLFALFFLSSFVQANVPNSGKSAYRDPRISYEVYKAQSSVFSLYSNFGQGTSTPVGAAVRFGTQPLPPVVRWPSRPQLQNNFEALRDVRFLIDPRHSKTHLRRSSWLYPDDGCFARAGLLIRNIAKIKQPLPNKVFVFGNLTVQTPNSEAGSVTWWYHVAPIVEVEGKKFVLDPAIEPKSPLPLEAWLERMNPNPQSLEVAICESGAYAPYDECSQKSDGVENLAESDQLDYLGEEWERVLRLNRNPEMELGDSPPWK